MNEKYTPTPQEVEELLATAKRMEEALCQGAYPELQGVFSDLGQAIAKMEGNYNDLYTC